MLRTVTELTVQSNYTAKQLAFINIYKLPVDWD